MISVEICGFRPGFYFDNLREKDVEECIRTCLCLTRFKNVEVRRLGHSADEVLPDGSVRKFLRIVAPTEDEAVALWDYIGLLYVDGKPVQVDMLVDPSCETEVVVLADARQRLRPEPPRERGTSWR